MYNALLLLFAMVGSDPGVREGITMGPPLSRTVTFVQELGCKSASGQGWLADVEVRVAVPRDDHRQRISDLRFDPEPERILEDPFGNRVAVFRISRIAPRDDLRVGWSCRVATRAAHHVVQPSRLGRLEETPEAIRRSFLRRDRRYGMDDPDVRALARRLGREATSPLDLAFRINEALRDRLTYRNDGLWENADRVLANGHGSCSEYSFLFIALARLNGLPARHVGASALRSSGPVYEDRIHHRWTEVYLPGHGWFPVDASRNDGEDGSPVNRYFGRTSPRLLVLVRGDGGAQAPLGWNYVVKLASRGRGDGRLAGRKHFLWTRTGRTAAGGGN